MNPTGAGVGFIWPTKRKLAKASAVKRVLGKSAFSRGRRSSLIVRAASLSTHDLVLLQEQVTALSNSRQNEDKKEVVLPNKNLIFRLLNLNRVLLWGSVFRGEGSRNEDNFLNSGCCAGPQVSGRQSSSSFSCYVFFSAFCCALFFFSGHGVFHGTLQKTGKQFNFRFGCCRRSSPEFYEVLLA